MCAGVDAGEGREGDAGSQAAGGREEGYAGSRGAPRAGSLYVCTSFMFVYVCMYRTICLLDRSRVFIFVFYNFAYYVNVDGMGWDGQRRKDYARKQKEKLLNYQKNFITEAGKIQELMDLGIDPQLLMKS